ncbi:MAG: Sec-independent protein translocase subunit TatA [Actinobacteria bacterium]|nr:Sec-independent protein translocase subunit TatA [Actinomycetota bacterium]
MGAFGWPHLLIILAVVLLLFGAAKLPALAKSVGQSARVFKGEMKAMKEDDKPAAASDLTSGTAQSAAEAPVTPSSTADPKP